MSKISENTKKTIKNQILNIVSDNFQSTNNIAKKIGRSWEFTSSLLSELKNEKKIIELQISNLKVWKKYGG